MDCILGTCEDGSSILLCPFLNSDMAVMTKEKSPSCEPKKLKMSADDRLTERKNPTYLRIIKLILLTCFRSRGLASSFSRPRYVGLNSFQCTKTFPPSLSPLKSYSQLTVLCSLPLGLFGKSSSFSIRVYFFPSDFLISNVMQS